MSQTSSFRTRIFYDGTDLATYGSHSSVTGFTTNTSFMKAAGVTNYAQFLETHKEIIQNRPISLQIFSDDHETIYAQAKQISALGDHVYAKVPIQTSTGEYNTAVILRLLQEGVKVNVTAMFTRGHTDRIREVLLQSTTQIILSIFAGRISDTGVDPLEIVQYAVEQVRDFPHAMVLWAGCKDNASIVRAENVGCHIVTVPETILARIGRIGMPLETMALDTVRMFLEDGVKGGLTIA